MTERCLKGEMTEMRLNRRRNDDERMIEGREMLFFGIDIFISLHSAVVEKVC